MEIRSSPGPLNEYFPESHCCATPDGRGDENICPEDEVNSTVVVLKRSRKDGRLNLRKSLAWNPAFFTEEGVLDSSELSIITDSATKSSSEFLSKNYVESSSIMQPVKVSKRPPLNNLEENSLSGVHTRSMSRSRNKRAANFLSISEESKHDGPRISMTSSRAPSSKGMPPKLNVACLMLEREKASKVQIEKDLKLNSCLSSSNRSHREMSWSGPSGMNCSVKEKTQNFHWLPPAPIQTKQSTFRMPYSHGSLEKGKSAKPLFEKDPILLKLNPCPSSSTKSQMETTCSGSDGTFSSISQQRFTVPGLPPAPIQAKSSGLRRPSPSLGFFQQKKVSSSHSEQLERTSQVPIDNSASLRKPANLKRVSLSKPPVAQTEQKQKKDFEAHTEMKMKQFDRKATISSNVCGRSNCPLDVAKEIATNCFSVSHKMDEKTRKVLREKPYTGRTTTRELADDDCSMSQICSKTSTEGSGMIEKVLHCNGFRNTGDSSSIAAEISSTSSEMHFAQNLNESNSKPLNVYAPVMNGELILHKDAIDGNSIRGFSEEACLYTEPRKDPTDEGGVQNGEELFQQTISQVQQNISGKSQTGELQAISSQNVQLAASREFHPQDELQLCESRNETSMVEENGSMPAKNISFDNLRQDTVLLKHHLSAVPYSDEWLAAIEAFGEDILVVKTGTVHNSPPDKDIPEPGLWSPVKRKAQDVGPFDCTKYSVRPFLREE
ncbi:uncharacterized protein LOC110018670 [Phalaenopsis equestris]|uniref:uncharacterized protein LOC110018670 n=1 Tax=Phalaenopsis equestris TaxID=78828 RepID=UPI0009E38156|nr:uncharacterized protein LOC110018670 [Phalaenopsis equestris]